MKTRLMSSPSTLGALVCSCLILWGCPEPRPERPDAPQWRLEVIRQAARDNGFGEVAIRVDPSGSPRLLFNDLEHQAVALARLGAHTWRVDYPVTQPSWMGLALAEADGDRSRLRYALSPRTVVDAEWDGASLTESGRQDLSEEAFRAFRASGGTLTDSAGQTYPVRLDGPRALACDHPTFERCPPIEARPGQRIVGSAIAAIIDERNRPHLLFFEQQLETPGDRAVLRYAVCDGERWDAFTLGPADTAGAALAVDGRGHPHFAFIRPAESGEGQELVYGTSAAPPERPSRPWGESCPEGMVSTEGGCAPTDPRVAAALDGCARIELSDVPVEAPHEAPDGFRCLVASRTPELSAAALAYARERCESGEATFCALAAGLHDTVVAWMTFDPQLCTPRPGGTCMDHTVQVMGVPFSHISSDRSEILALYRRACDGGHDGACLRLASLVLSRDRDDALAYRVARPRCEEGGHVAACAMAVEACRASDQEGEEALRAAALRVFERRCDEPHPSACTNLGYMLVRGEGIAEDRARAAALFQRACEAGHEPGCTNHREASR